LRYAPSVATFILPRWGRHCRTVVVNMHRKSGADAILSVRLSACGDSGIPRKRALANFGGAPSHSTNVRQSPLSASTIEFVHAKSASSTKTANNLAFCRLLRR